MDTEGRRILRGRRSAHLTPAEARLLEVLLSCANEVVPSTVLVALLHGDAISFRHGLARVKFVVSRLRKKLGRARSCLETSRGEGFVLRLRAARKSSVKSGRRRGRS